MQPVKEEHPDLPAPTKLARAAQFIGNAVFAVLGHAREIFAGRMSQWLWITIGLVALIGFINAELLGPIFKVLAKMTMGASLGYGLDRTAFKYFRPHGPSVEAFKIENPPPLGKDEWRQILTLDYKSAQIRHLQILSALYQFRRAIVIAACVVGSTMGL